MKRWRGLIRLLESAIDGGTRIVETVHKDVGSRPFEILENVPSVAQSARELGQLYGTSVSQVYEAIRVINRVVSRTALSALELAESGRELPIPPTECNSLSLEDPACLTAEPARGEHDSSTA